MSVFVRIPIPLRPLAGGVPTVEAEGGSVSEVLGSLDGRFPGIRDRLYDEKGLRKFVNVFLNGEDIRFLDGEETPVKEGDRLSIIPAIAGG